MRLALWILGFSMIAFGQVHAEETQNLQQIYQQALTQDPVLA